MDKTHTRYFAVCTFITAFCLFTGMTYSYFAFNKQLEAAIITTANLKYQLTSTNTNFDNNSLTIKPNEALTLELNLKSLNNQNTKYALDYLTDSDDVKVYYIENREQNVFGEIAGLNSIITIKIAIKNTSTTQQTVTFDLKGGYLQNTLESNIIEGTVDVAKIIKTLAKEGTPDFTKLAPTPLAYEDTNFDSVEEERMMAGIGYNGSYYYSDSYSFDSETGLYSLIDPQLCTYKTCYQELVGKYLPEALISVNDGEAASQTTDKNKIYKVEYTSLGELHFKQSTKKITEYDTSNDGVFKMDDNYGTSYFFRGYSENNYVYFAGFYWRIIRLNGDGSLRLIYDGTTPYSNGVSNIDRVTTSSLWNENRNDNKYVGYMFGGDDGVASTSMTQAQTNTTESIVKTNLDKWYEENILDKNYNRYVSDTLFCNDRSVGDNTSYWENLDKSTGKGWGTNKTTYGFWTRFDLDTGMGNVTRADITLKCPQQGDAFTVNDKSKGNGALTHPVGMITADEVYAAGGGWSKNTNYYLYKGVEYFTLSPSRGGGSGGGNVSMSRVYEEGLLGRKFITEESYIAPVINLNSEVVKIMLGDGTKNNPYKYIIDD